MVEKNTVLSFLQSLDCKNISHGTSDTGWIRASCPLAPWTHVSGKDDRPSFGVHIPEDDRKAAHFHCYSCGVSGPLPRLLHNITWFSSQYPQEASRVLSRIYPLFDLKEDEQEDRKPRRMIVSDKFKQLKSKEFKRNLPVPEELLQRYPLLIGSKEDFSRDVLEWLVEKRKISLQAIARYQLRYYADPFTGDPGVIFPIIDRQGTVYDFWVRKAFSKVFFRLNSRLTGVSTDYHAPNMWFGQHLYEAEKPLVLVEGALDALRLNSLGVPVVFASQGEPSAEQLATVFAPVVYVGFDADEAGKRFAKKTVRALSSPSVYYLDWGVVGRKDAGELESPGEFRKVFESKRFFPNVSESRKATVKPPKKPAVKKVGLFDF